MSTMHSAERVKRLTWVVMACSQFATCVICFLLPAHPGCLQAVVAPVKSVVLMQADTC